MKTKSKEEIIQMLNSGLFNHCSLYDGNKNSVIIQMNRYPKDYDSRKSQVLTQMDHRLSEGDPLKVELKSEYKSAPESFLIYSENQQPIETQQTMHKNYAINLPSDFTDAMNHPAVKLQAQITQLELENEDLCRQIEELNEYVAELEEKLQTANLSEAPKEPTTMEIAKNFLSEIVTMGAPLLDKHFELKQQQLELERMRMNGYQQPKQVAPPQMNKIEIGIKKWIESKSDDPELYGSLCAMYINSDSPQKFAELLNNFNPEYYAECKRSI